MNTNRIKWIIKKLYHSKDTMEDILFRLPRLCSDKMFIKLAWKRRMGYPLDLSNPTTFNEKLQWLKLYDRRPIYTTMVDKYAVKKYVSDIIGDEYVIPTLGVWDRPEDIDWDSLPNQFVLKCTHDSGGLVICRDKQHLDKAAAIKNLQESLNRDYYMLGREWPYKNVRRRIIAEKYLTDDGNELKDYKVLTFGGEPKIIEIDYNRFKGHLRNLYDTNWKLIDATIEYPSDPQRTFEKPSVLEELLELSCKLAKGTPHLRTDFYIVDDKIFFGELTFFHGNGMESFIPESFGKELGDWIVLPIPEGGSR